MFRLLLKKALNGPESAVKTVISDDNP